MANAEGAVGMNPQSGLSNKFMFTDSPPNPAPERYTDISDQIVEDDGVGERDVITPNHSLPMPLA